MKPRFYNPPTLDHLVKARDAFLHDSSLSADHDQIEKILDPLMALGDYHTIIAFWIWFRESKLIDSPQVKNNEIKETKGTEESKTESKATPETSVIRLANFALNVEPRNSLDVTTRLNYLAKFIIYTQKAPGLKLKHELALFYFARLLYETPLIHSPIHAIRQFEKIPQLREASKRAAAKKQSYLDQLKRLTVELVASRKEQRARQIAFIQVLVQLMTIFEKTKAPLYLEDLLKGFAFWIMHETEQESDFNTSESHLYKVLQGMFGYNHTNELSGDKKIFIKTLRIQQLLDFLPEVNDRHWESAAKWISTEQYKILYSHYFRNYEALKHILTTLNTPRSTSMVVGMGASRAAWGTTSTLVRWCVPTIATNAYDALHLDAVASTVGNSIASTVGSYVGPTLRWIIETPLKKISATAAKGGIQAGVQATLSLGVEHCLSDSSSSPSKPEPELIKPPKILFENFITLALEAASKARDIPNCELYETILFIFPLLPRRIRELFNHNVADWYFTPTEPKGPCPFRIEMPHLRSEAKEVSQPSAPTPPPAPKEIFPLSSTNPPPTVPVSVVSLETPSAPPISPLRAVGMTKVLNEPVVAKEELEGEPDDSALYKEARTAIPSLA